MGGWVDGLIQLEGVYGYFVPRADRPHLRDPTSGFLIGGEAVFKGFVTGLSVDFVTAGNARVQNAAGINLLVNPNCFSHHDFT
jgi:hypothetical protein